MMKNQIGKGSSAIGMDINKLKHKLNTQDNLATSHPLFVVFEKFKIYVSESDDVCYYDHSQGEEIDLDNLMKDVCAEDEDVHGYYCEDDDDKIDYLRNHGYDIEKMYYTLVDRFATVCLTRDGAEAYLRVNGHNLNQPHIFVASAYRNQEMIEIQEYFKNFNEEIIITNV